MLFLLLLLFTLEEKVVCVPFSFSQLLARSLTCTLFLRTDIALIETNHIHLSLHECFLYCVHTAYVLHTYVWPIFNQHTLKMMSTETSTHLLLLKCLRWWWWFECVQVCLCSICTLVVQLCTWCVCILYVCLLCTNFQTNWNWSRKFITQRVHWISLSLSLYVFLFLSRLLSITINWMKNRSFCVNKLKRSPLLSTANWMKLDTVYETYNIRINKCI